ncbi:hypothetical protein D3C75_579700 [compost metagenome]
MEEEYYERNAQKMDIGNLDNDLGYGLNFCGFPAGFCESARRYPSTHSSNKPRFFMENLHCRSFGMDTFNG